jgi:outer membrane biosynthesis protein TonB
MELTDIMALVKAGFTRDEIKEMELSQAPVQPNPAPVSEPTPAPAPVAEPEPAPVAQPVPQPVPVPTQAPAEPTMAELMQSIAKLTSAVQANAIAQSVIPGAGNPQAPTAEDMLAEIIRPTFKERNQ